MEKSYFSVRRVWSNTASIGIGFGWDRYERSACVFVMFGLWAAVIGPHLPQQDSEGDQ